MYTLLQTRLKESEITAAMEDPIVQVVDPAVVPERPERPRPVRYLALSVVLGSLLGVTLALGREWSDRAVRSRADALSAGGLPVLGAIPRATLRRTRWLSRPRDRRGQSGLGAIRGQPSGRIAVGNTPQGRAATKIAGLLVTRPDMPGVFTEAFNQLHANLTLAHQDRPLKVLVFTSPLPGEGKTLSAINFALTVAGRGQRVLLIDADLRCGLVNLVFGSPRQPGFTELLAAKTRFEDATRRLTVGETGVLVIMPSGALQPAGRPLTVSRLREVLAGLGARVDLVVIDSPPINVLADAAILGAASDGVVLVVRAGRTQSDALRYAMDQLSAGRAPVVGTLLNDIDLRRNASDDRAYRYMAEVSRYHGADAPAEGS
jgi:tyrosine-protein kinase Etk/Wzc